MHFASKVCFVVIIFMLLFSITAEVSAGTWLKYDDGAADWRLSNVSPQHLGVFFDLPNGESHQILTISYYIYASPVAFRAHIYSNDANNVLTDVFSFDVTSVPTGSWIYVGVSPPNSIHVKGYGSYPHSFFVTVEYLSNNGPEIGMDTTSLYDHSFAGPLGGWANIGTLGNVMIRAETQKITLGSKRPPSEPPTPPQHVGGELYSANKLALLSPYLALISVVAVAAVLVKRRRT